MAVQDCYRLQNIRLRQNLVVFKNFHPPLSTQWRFPRKTTHISHRNSMLKQTQWVEMNNAIRRQVSAAIWNFPHTVAIPSLKIIAIRTLWLGQCPAPRPKDVACSRATDQTQLQAVIYPKIDAVSSYHATDQAQLRAAIYPKREPRESLKS